MYFHYLQAFDPPSDEENENLGWRVDGVVITCIGGAALVVFIVYFCHVTRRKWKVWGVIPIRPHYKRSPPIGAGEVWHGPRNLDIDKSEDNLGFDG